MGNHGRIGRVRIQHRIVPARLGNGSLFLSQLVHIVQDLVFGRLNRTVRHGRGPHRHKGPIGMVHNKLLQLVVHQVRRVVLLVEFVVRAGIVRIGPRIQAAVHRHIGVSGLYAMVVFPQHIRIIGMGKYLTYKAVEIIEPHIRRHGAGTRIPQSPFPHHRGFITGLLHHPGERRGARGQRELSLEGGIGHHPVEEIIAHPLFRTRIRLVIQADLAMPGMHPGQDGTAGRGR